MTPHTAALGLTSAKIAGGSHGAIYVVRGDFSVDRVRLGGGLDSGFGSGGVAHADLSGFHSVGSSDAAVLRDGKVVVVGWVSKTECPERCARRFVAVRYTRRGRLDPTFGEGGVVLRRWRGVPLCVTVLTGGDLAVGGTTYYGYPFIARLHPDGTIDRGFGVRGRKVVAGIPEEGAVSPGEVADLHGLPGGGVIGSFVSGESRTRSGLIRLGPRGRVEHDLGGLGIAFHPPPGVAFNFGQAFAQLRDGKLLLVGTTTPPEIPHVALVRLLRNGWVDESYGADGVAVGPAIPSSGPLGLAASVTGEAVVSSDGLDAGGSLFRFSPAGSLDTSFGVEGTATVGEDSLSQPAWAPPSQSLLRDGSIAITVFDRDSREYLSRYSVFGKQIFSIRLPESQSRP